MELRAVDPTILKPNPKNPRHSAAGDHPDEQFVANIKTVGILQPPLVKETDKYLEIIAGHRRVRAAIAAGLTEIFVLIKPPDDSNDTLCAVSENVVRANLNPVDQWRAIESLSSDHWTDDAIGAALALPVRMIKKLRLLAHLYPPMLDHLAKGDMPTEAQLRHITGANNQEQASVWKKHKPKKGGTAVDWYSISTALQKRRLYAEHAKFGPDEEQAFGITWLDDLFAPGDKDTRYTTDAEAFLAAQTAWLEANLPKNGLILTVDEYGAPKLPPKAERTWSAPKRGDTIGFYINFRDGSVEDIVFRLPKTDAKSDTTKTKHTAADATEETAEHPKKPRAEITSKGQEMIGEFRTAALSKAILENEIDDSTLLALLVIAFTANNVDIKSNDYTRGAQRTVLQKLTEGGHLSQDLTLVRQSARDLLAATLSCRTNYNSSGIAARFAGDAIGADAHLPNMATEEFLPCLSKAALERAASTIGVLPRHRAKETRAAVISEAGKTHFVLPAATFAPTANEIETQKTEAARHFRPEYQDDEIDNPNDNNTATDPSLQKGDETLEEDETSPQYDDIE